ncbi:hypothetical protein ACS0TY_000449 [Phlomoides rotata]
MIDYGAVMIATALFAFLCPGLMIQIPGKNKPVEFVNMKTTIAAMVFHTILYGREKSSPFLRRPRRLLLVPKDELRGS